MYRYYFLLHPPAPGTHPRGATKVVSFDQKKLVPEIEREAWGYAEYEEQITDLDNWDLLLDDSNLPVITFNWYKEDIKVALEKRGIEPSAENINKFLKHGSSTFKERSVEESWIILDDLLSIQFRK